MIWTDVALSASLGFNVGYLVWSIFAARRLSRTLAHAQALDDLLAVVVVQAFAERHQPIWAAWAASMGEISIEVTQTRKKPGDHNAV